MAVTVLDKRVCYNRLNGSACGDISLEVIDAELTLDDNGKLVYVYAQWIDNAPDEIQYATFPRSMYDLKTAQGTSVEADMDALDALYAEQIDDLYGAYYEELRSIVLNELRVHNIDSELLEGGI